MIIWSPHFLEPVICRTQINWKHKGKEVTGWGGKYRDELYGAEERLTPNGLRSLVIILSEVENVRDAKDAPVITVTNEKLKRCIRGKKPKRHFKHGLDKLKEWKIRNIKLKRSFAIVSEYDSTPRNRIDIYLSKDFIKQIESGKFRVQMPIGEMWQIENHPNRLPIALSIAVDRARNRRKKNVDKTETDARNMGTGTLLKYTDLPIENAGSPGERKRWITKCKNWREQLEEPLRDALESFGVKTERSASLNDFMRKTWTVTGAFREKEGDPEFEFRDPEFEVGDPEFEQRE